MQTTEFCDATTASELLPGRLRRQASLEQSGRAVMAFLNEQLSVQQSWTFQEIDRRACAIAAELQQRGLSGHPTVLAYTAGMELEFVAAFCACLYAGAIAVPMRLTRSARVDERIGSILSDSGASHILTLSSQTRVIERQMPPASSVAFIATDEVNLDRWKDWIPVGARPEQIALLQYTSGSTRTPSGVMISHGNLAANLESLRQVWCTHPGSVGVSWLPLFHDMGLIAGVLEPLWVGYSTFLMAPATFVQNPLRWLQALTRYRGTIAGGPNSAYQACVEAAKSSDLRSLELSAWDLAWNGAEHVRASTLEQFRATFASVGFRPESMTPGYGLAEATLMVTGDNGRAQAFELVVDDSELHHGRVRHCTEGPNAKRLVSSGRPADRTSVRIVHPENSVELKQGVVGEIWIRSDGVGQGYWNKPEDTLYAFGARLETGEGPFLRTGDLGFLCGKELFVTGRLKDMIVVRGVNYSPHDIEHTVERSHAALRPDAGVVIGLEEGGKVRLVAVHELRRTHRRTADTAEIFLAIRRAVARENQLALDGIVLLKPYGLPKTSSGKVQRARCRAALREGSLSLVDQWWAPASVAPIYFNGQPLSQPRVLERQLSEWLERELSLPDLTWHTPLASLGVESLKAVELSNVLSSAFNHPFPGTLIIEYPTIEALAGFIREHVLSVPQKRCDSAARGPSKVAVAEQIDALSDQEVEAVLKKSVSDILGSAGVA